MSLQDLLSESFEHDKDLSELNRIDREKIVYAQLKRNASKHFNKISGGTGRDVYDFKDNKVIKLAKNEKGIAQNEAEYSMGTDSYIDNVVTQVFYGAENFSFLISEKAKKVTVGDFKRLVGVDWKYYVDYMEWWGKYLTVSNLRYSPDEEIIKIIEEKLLEEDNQIYKFKDFIASYDMGQVVGDLTRLSSYGIVQRDYGEDIVLVDYGLTPEVRKMYYDLTRKYELTKPT